MQPLKADVIFPSGKTETSEKRDFDIAECQRRIAFRINQKFRALRHVILAAVVRKPPVTACFQVIFVPYERSEATPEAENDVSRLALKPDAQSIDIFLRFLPEPFGGAVF